MDNKKIARKLIQILRQDMKNKMSHKIKKNIALALAHTGEEDSIKELGNMLYGLFWWEKSWKTLWKEKLIYNYSDCLNNQLIAIDALSETKSPEALKCLENLIKNPESDPMPIYNRIYEVRFKNMRRAGELGEIFTVCKGQGSIKGYIEWASKKPEYKRIQNSINKLKKSIPAYQKQKYNLCVYTVHWQMPEWGHTEKVSLARDENIRYHRYPIS